MQDSEYQRSPKQRWRQSFFETPLGLIHIGVVMGVMTFFLLALLCYDPKSPWISGGGCAWFVGVVLMAVLVNKSLVYLRTHEFLVSEVRIDLRKLV